MLKIFILVGCLVITALWDFCTHKIPNRLLGVMGVMGLACNCYMLISPIATMLYFLLPVLCLLPLWLIKAMGAGDLKLMGVTGIFIGKHIWRVIFFSFFWAAILGIFLLIYKRQLLSGMKRGICYILSMLMSKKVMVYSCGIHSGKAVTVPYAVCILLGTFTWLAFNYGEAAL